MSVFCCYPLIFLFLILMEFCFSYCFYVFSAYPAQANAPLIDRGCHMGKGHPQKVHPASPCPVALLRLYYKVSEVASIQHQRYRYLEATRCWPKFLLVSRCLRMYIPRLKAAIKKKGGGTFTMQIETINPTEATTLSRNIPHWFFFFFYLLLIFA